MATVSNALRSGGKREKIHDAQVVIKLPGTAKTLVNSIAQGEGVSDAAIYRRAVAEYLERRGYRA